MVVVWCVAVRECSSSVDIGDLQRRLRLLMPVLQPGLRLFPTSSKGVAKMNIFQTDTVVTQKVDLKQCWVTEALFLRWLDKIFLLYCRTWRPRKSVCRPRWKVMLCIFNSLVALPFLLTGFLVTLLAGAGKGVGVVNLALPKKGKECCLTANHLA